MKLSKQTSWIKATGHPELIILLLILSFGLLIRLLFLYLLKDAEMVGDAKDYYQIAVSLKNGERFHSLIRAPLYPYFISYLFNLFQTTNLMIIKLFQSLVSLLNVIFIYFLGKTVFDKKAGYIAAGIFCFYPTLLFYSNFVLTETLFICLFTIFLTGFVFYLKNARSSNMNLIISGVVLGLAALTRSIVLYLPILIALLMVALNRRSIYILLISFTLTILPWIYRNYVVYQAFIPIETIGKINILLGNYKFTPLNRAWDAHITQVGEKAWSYPLKQSGKHLSGVQKAGWALREGVKFMIHNPSLTALRSFVKFFNLWELERVPVSMAVKGLMGEKYKILLIILAACGWVFYLIILWGSLFSITCLCRKNISVHMFLWGIIFYFSLVHIITYGHPRYHLPLIPILTIYGSYALVSVKELSSQRKSVKFYFAVTCCLFFIFVWIRQIYVHVNNLYLV